jgi:hypothetical protein
MGPLEVLTRPASGACCHGGRRERVRKAFTLGTLMHYTF